MLSTRTGPNLVISNRPIYLAVISKRRNPPARGRVGFWPGRVNWLVQLLLARHPPLASLDPPSGRVAKPDDVQRDGDIAVAGLLPRVTPGYGFSFGSETLTSALKIPWGSPLSESVFAIQPIVLSATPEKRETLPLVIEIGWLKSSIASESRIAICSTSLD